MKKLSNYKNSMNYITGSTKEHGIQAIHVDGKSVQMSDETPITVERIAEMVEKLQVATGEEYISITVNHVAFESPITDWEEGPNPKVFDKRYVYYPKTNSMIIWENGMPVYANDNGVICRDRDALADSLM